MEEKNKVAAFIGHKDMPASKRIKQSRASLMQKKVNC
jgi:hypothetical protein